VLDLAGKTIYPGFLDAYSTAGIKYPDKLDDGGRYWNMHVRPERSASELFSPDSQAFADYRSQGICAVNIAPDRGVIKGTSSIVLCDSGAQDRLLIRAETALQVRLEPPPGSDSYPDSPMGAFALVRQALYDADWYAAAQALIRSNRKLPVIEQNVSLEALNDLSLLQVPLLIESRNELYALRAARIGDEFNWPVIIRGSGHEYKRLDALKATNRAFVIPVNFPQSPDVSTPENALNASLAELMHWDIAPENPARLSQAGLRIALTADGLKQRDEFLDKVRLAIQRGLSADSALAALTVNPAAMFGVASELGRIAPGFRANLIICSGDIFSDSGQVLETWVGGSRYKIEREPRFDVRGDWTISGGTFSGAVLSLTGTLSKPKGKLVTATDTLKLAAVRVTETQLVFKTDRDTLDNSGQLLWSASLISKDLFGTVTLSDGSSVRFTANRTSAFAEKPDSTEKGSDKALKASFPVNYPLGAFGYDEVPKQAANLALINATIWTCEDAGIIENGTLLINNGRISAVGKDISLPAGTPVFDAKGMHITPGMIDPHSHIASDGGINEGGHTITAEVRIGDFLDPNDDIIYRQLAGGTTASLILHGSANTIGGQSQVIKLRWAARSDEDLKMATAPAHIKFALGENVKQSNWGDKFVTRYPQSRMGVEQIVRDEFAAAKDYRKAWQTWNGTHSGLPPRRDLELDAIVEVLAGTRKIQCHSYRADEILALMRTCEAFGTKVWTFQHILEGYKVAAEMARHGAMGSCFTDWWAYKFEVYDAIPYNAALMHKAGVVTSFNSDSHELGRRMNYEAAKATKYGAVPPEEALKFTTLNPAKQMGVEQWIGSLKPGKDADFVIWNGPPMSTYSKPLQTWLDGRKYFDIDLDKELRARDQERKAVLIQKILASGETPGNEESKLPEYAREDIYCGHDYEEAR
jgi:N-acetylglucosamine-6-phosphate deacetylase